MSSLRTNHIRDAADFAAVFDVSRETVARLATYERLLRTWQKTINLVAPSTLDDVWHRHFADSAQVVAISTAAHTHAQPTLQWVDLGTGAGFPGLVVAILLAERGSARVTLVDSDQRKAAFCREVVRETGLKSAIAVDILVDRIEAPPNRSKAAPVDVVSARALAPLPKLLEWAHPYFQRNTVGVFLKGRDAGAEVKAAEAHRGWAFELRKSMTDPDARIVVARRL